MMKRFGSLIGAFLTLLVITLMVTIFTSTQGARDALGEKSRQIDESAEYSRVAAYDNVKKTGSDIKSAVKRFRAEDYFFIYVRYGAGLMVIDPSGLNTSAPNVDPTTMVVSKTTVPVNTAYADIDTEGSAKFLQPQIKWSSHLLSDDNGRIVGILFK